jgi:hypothetical protein
MINDQSDNFRIEDIKNAVLNGKQIKLFKAYKKQGKAFFFVGQYLAPRNTPKKALWKIVVTN